GRDVSTPPIAFGRDVTLGSANFTYRYDRLFDRNCAANRIVEWTLNTHLHELLQDAETQKRLSEWREAIRKYARDNGYDARLVGPVEADDWDQFYSCFASVPREHWNALYLGRPRTS